MSLHVLFSNEIEGYRKVSLCSFFSLIGMSQLLAARYLLKMWKNVTSNHYFEMPCDFT